MSVISLAPHKSHAISTQGRFLDVDKKGKSPCPLELQGESVGDGYWRAVELGTGLHRAGLSVRSHQCDTPQRGSSSLASSTLETRLSLTAPLYQQICRHECLVWQRAVSPRVVAGSCGPSVSRVPLLLLSALAARAPLPQESSLPREADSPAGRSENPSQPILARLTSSEGP